MKCSAVGPNQILYTQYYLLYFDGSLSFRFISIALWMVNENVKEKETKTKMKIKTKKDKNSTTKAPIVYPLSTDMYWWTRITFTTDNGRCAYYYEMNQNPELVGFLVFG